MKIMFQGRADMKPEDVDYKAVKRLGQMLAEQSHEAISGAYGGTVQALLESGIKCHGYLHHRQLEELPEGFATFTDCRELALVNLQFPCPYPSYSGHAVAWGVHLGLMMETAEAFVFFAGGVGSSAHLAAVLAFNRKHWVPQGKPKKVVLLEFSREQYQTLKDLDLLPKDGEYHWYTTKGAGYTDEELRWVVDFLTGGQEKR